MITQLTHEIGHELIPQVEYTKELKIVSTPITGKK